MSSADISVGTKLNALVAVQIVALLAVAGIGLYAPSLQMGATQAASLMGLVIVLSGALALWVRLEVRRGILRSIRGAAEVIERVAQGDLGARVKVRSHGETQKMLDALEDMVGGLRTLVGEVTRSAGAVADTSSQIAQGNLDLSQRTEEQASTLEETASSMEELTSTVANNADNARQASKLAAEAADAARKGGQAVDDVVRTMDDILDASRRIADIIGVIDGIAFQTNILALNAAVEAARAGEQGRGFAVVAAEVRNLAHRTTAAAKEIKGLIADSEQKAQTGSDRVDAAGHTMVGLVMSVQKVSGLITEIAAASQEQSAGIGQVNGAVAQMERVVQQNASLVEEAAAATESLKDQADALLALVSRFGQGGAPHAAVAPPRAAPARRTAAGGAAADPGARAAAAQRAAAGLRRRHRARHAQGLRSRRGLGRVLGPGMSVEEAGLGEAEFELARRLIADYAGIKLSPHKRHMVHNRLSRRLRARGLGSFAEYLQLVQDDPRRRARGLRQRAHHQPHRLLPRAAPFRAAARARRSGTASSGASRCACGARPAPPARRPGRSR